MTTLRTSPAVGLQWVKGEIDTSLSRARGLIEQHLESPENTQVLQQAIIELHLVNGSAGVVQCYGIVALTEEMIQTLQALVQGQIAEREAAFTGLLGATVQLSDYVDILAAGRDDCAPALLPLINELRVAQGRGVRSEADLIAAEMLFLGVRVDPSELHAADGIVLSTARRLLPIFQSSLLHWLKENDTQALLRVGKIAAQVANESSTAAGHELWRAAAACTEALLLRSMDDSQDIRRLFGRVLPQLKLLADHGEDSAAEHAGDLVYYFVFHLARSRANSARAQSLRQDYQVARHVPSAEAVEEFRRRIRGPNTTLLNRLAREIRQDLVDVKDRIDLIVRTRQRNDSDFDAIAAGLKRVSNTLNVLGLATLQHVVANQLQRLQPLRAAPGTESLWMEMAVALLRVEQGLDGALFRQLRNLPDPGKRDFEEQTPHSADLREGVAALVREALVDLARLKTAVDGYLRSGDASALPEASRSLGQISSSLRLLEDARAAQLIGRLLDAMSGPAFAELCQDQAWADSFAEAVAFIEVYLEALRDRQPDADAILDELAQRVTGLQQQPQTEVVEPTSVEETLVETPAPALVVEAIPVDDEIRGIFLEEAGEVRALLESKLKAFRSDPEQHETLTEIRRAFHTLKGSGRMVGATRIGEFAWAIENMLNRCLDGSIPIGQPVVDTIVEAVSRLAPQMEAFRLNQAGPDVTALVDKAQRLAAGKMMDAEAESELLAVFREDAGERISEIRGWMDRQDTAANEFEIDETTRRAFHTLRGSAAIVNLPEVSQLAGSLEAYLGSLRGAGLKLGAAGLELLRDAAAAIEQWVEVAPAAPVADIPAWQSRIKQIQAQVPEKAQREEADRGLAEVFASEALGLLQDIESTTRDWARAPENRTSPRTLGSLYQTLYGAALMSECSAIANVAHALEQLMGDAVHASRLPDAQYFQRLGALQEQMYQQLDQFHDGTLTDAGEALVAEVQALRSGVSLPSAAEPAVPAPAVPESAEPALELRDIFIAEAEEVLQGMDREADAWERAPHETTPLHELRRSAHTLKGSSRMASVAGVDEVAERLETLLEDVAGGTVAADGVLFAKLHNAIDGLYRMVGDIRQGIVPDARAVLADLEAAAPFVPDVAEIVAPPVEPVAMEPTPAESEAEFQAAEEASAEEVRAFDPEMAEVFAAEAAELLEQLETGLAAWQADTQNVDAARDVLRALHTLKGGARMGGLVAIGSAAHDMETHVTAIESGQHPADAAAFTRLRLELEMLQRMHDALGRGEAARLAEPAAPFETPAPGVPAFELAPPPSAMPAPASAVSGLWDPRLFWQPEEERAGAGSLRRETARVPVEHLEAMLNQAGEISIYRSRLEQQTSALMRSLVEMDQTIARMREQLRSLNIETEAQIAARGFITGTSPDRYGGQFDPLEMDRYSRMQELSRAIAESVGDLHSLHETMTDLSSESETLLLQQSRISTDVQQGLMGTLMVPFSRQVQRLQRLVRQVAEETGKQADVQFAGVEAELDRNVLERMTAPLEHLLRNAVVHGIEAPGVRRERGKPEIGEIRVQLAREGTRLLMELSDDGGGLDFSAIRAVAVERGLMAADAELPDDELAQFIFQPGFSTARQLTQAAGRGVGMDVVASEVKQLGGALDLRSETGKGMRLVISLPLTLAISQALLVSVGHEMYAIPLPSIEGIARVPVARLNEHYAEDGPPLPYGNRNYRVRYLGDFLGLPRHDVTERTVPAILVRVAEGLGAQERRVAVVVDVLHGNREIVSKSAGPQVSSVTGLTGATILPDGQVVLILDIPALVQERARRATVAIAARAAAEARELILVVDDSITIRRVTERLLAKNGYRVATAKDGLDAMAWLQTESPAAILLDIEMPRADGFEVAAFVRNNERTRGVPIIMITSRSGEKHRERARDLGVDRYVIKPYQEEQLMGEIRSVLVRH